MRRKEKINSDTERRWMWLSIVSLAPPDVLNMGQGGWMLYPRNCICSPELIRGPCIFFGGWYFALGVIICGVIVNGKIAYWGGDGG